MPDEADPAEDTEPTDEQCALAQYESWLNIHDPAFTDVLNRALLQRFVQQGRATTYETYASTVKALNDSKSLLVEREGAVLQSRGDADDMKLRLETALNRVKEESTTTISRLEKELETQHEELKAKQETMDRMRVDLRDGERKIEELQGKVKQGEQVGEAGGLLVERVKQLENELESVRVAQVSVLEELELERESHSRLQKRFDARYKTIEALQTELALFEEENQPRPAKKR